MTHNGHSLSGKKVVITRAVHQADETADKFRNLGAEVISVPVIDIAPVQDQLDLAAKALHNPSEYQWIVFTSTNTVRFLSDVLRSADLTGCSIAAIGSSTADMLYDYGINVDVVPETFVAESLVASLLEANTYGHPRCLIPRAKEARDVLPNELRNAGWQVDVIPIYETHLVDVDDAGIAALREADVITFTSPSTVRAALRSVVPGDLKAKIACIGPITAQAAESAGLSVDIQADEHTIDGLIGTIAARL